LRKYQNIAGRTGAAYIYLRGETIKRGANGLPSQSKRGYKILKAR
jgi:hypothetical protein